MRSLVFVLAGAIVLSLALGACSSSKPNQSPSDLSLSTQNDDLAVADDLAGARDLSGARDLASRPQDLAGIDLTGRDLAMPDLASAPGDLAGVTAAGQCWNDSHCPNGSCSVEAAGGICTGCGIPMDHCPPDYDVCAPGAACSTGCGTADDCPQPSVQACVSSSGDTFCAQKSCSAGECGPLHECRGGFCKRILCPNGNECPAGTTCRGTGTKVCVEDHLTFP